MWLLFGVASHWFWAIENVATKLLLGNKVKNPYVMLMLLTVASVVILPFFSLNSITLPNPWLLVYLVLASGFYVLGGLPYTKALQLEEVTRINIFWSAIPIFSLVIGWFALGDSLKPVELLAMIFLLLGMVVAALTKGGVKIKLSRAFWLMMLSCLSFAVYGVIIRFVSRQVNFVGMFFWVTLFNGLIAACFIFNNKIKKDLRETAISGNKLFWLAILFITLCSDAGIFLNQWALSLKPGALVYSLEGFQILFVFALAAIIHLKRPAWLDESLDKINLMFKFFGFVLVMLGVYILNFVK